MVAVTISKYPKTIDDFTTKFNIDPSLPDVDGNGDYVDADHVNYLQSAVRNIELTLGTNPQGSALNIKERLSITEESRSMRTPSLCMYLGDPFVFNGSTNKDEAVNQFLYFNNIVLQIPTEEGRDAFKLLVESIKSSRDVTLYGYTNVALHKNDFVAIQMKIATWKELGADGIMLDKIGYDQGISRVWQNELVDFVHSLNMSCLVSATNHEDVLMNDYHGILNPNYLAHRLKDGDAYLHDYFAVDENGYMDAEALFSKCRSLTASRKLNNVKLFALGRVNGSILKEEAQQIFNYVQAIAIMFSYDAFYVTTGDSVALFKNLSLVGNYYDRDPKVLTDSNGLHYRIGSFGKIIVDTEYHMYTLEGISIPGEAIFGNVSNIGIRESQMTGGAIESSNWSLTEGSRIDLGASTMIFGGTQNPKFKLDKHGTLTAKGADIDGKITATSGAIAGWDIGESTIHKKNVFLSSEGYIYTGNNLTPGYKKEGVYLGYDSITNYAKLSAYSNENHYLTWDGERVTIASDNFALDNQGKITATGGLIGNWIIGENDISSQDESIILSSGEDSHIKIGSDPEKYLELREGAITAVNGSMTNIAIDGDGIHADAITTGFLSADRIETGSLNAEKIVTGSITAEQIAAGAITAELISTDAITTEHLQANVIEAINASLDYISAGKIVIGDNFLEDELEDLAGKVTYKVDIFSTNGNIFKAGNVSTILIARVYHGAEDITDTIEESKFIWQRMSEDSEADTLWNSKYSSGRKQIEITTDDVTRRATFNCLITI